MGTPNGPQDWPQQGLVQSPPFGVCREASVRTIQPTEMQEPKIARPFVDHESLGEFFGANDMDDHPSRISTNARKRPRGSRQWTGRWSQAELAFGLADWVRPLDLAIWATDHAGVAGLWRTNQSGGCRGQRRFTHVPHGSLRPFVGTSRNKKCTPGRDVRAEVGEGVSATTM
ncbi:hypothetical protein BO70DRAFT_399921 [Aspergillus heteromorphus CBS 117.55]|uniref:Uncharacterized protein n=1 Tax=Aspergillus heteromorphus CBS 117.55 TaxID=1448321 RepID=A0A317V9L1_9EURO|nr:uncharacterized protein BO70DRAFT_399921 [Aspergillus heteromorphus CBS 117.55]PWY69718.1 hypothetical protein BO70DRAFT_399921 [Aspergillus heteromorphus CBS 117.55]